MLYTCLRKKICKGKSFNSFHKEKRKNISIIMGNTCGNSCFYTGSSGTYHCRYEEDTTLTIIIATDPFTGTVAIAIMEKHSSRAANIYSQIDLFNMIFTIAVTSAMVMSPSLFTSAFSLLNVSTSFPKM